MHPVLPRPVPTLDRPRITTTDRVVKPRQAPASRGGAHRALPARRTPAAAEFDAGRTAAVLQAVLVGLNSVPDRVVVPLPQRLRNAVVARWQGVDAYALRSVAVSVGAAVLAFALVLAVCLGTAQLS